MCIRDRAIGGKKIIKSVGMDMVKMEPYQGFSASTTTFSCLVLATFTGLPVSTTHTATTAIMGVGASRRIRAVRWSMAGNMVLTLSLIHIYHSKNAKITPARITLDEGPSVVIAPMMPM